MKPETTTHQSVMIDEISADGTILACDPAQAIALGYDQASLIGTPVSTLYPLPSRRILEAHRRRRRRRRHRRRRQVRGGLPAVLLQMSP